MVHKDIDNIKFFLAKKRLSYQKLAYLTEIDESKLKRVFSGRQDLTLTDRDRVYAALDININAIETGQYSEMLSLAKRLTPQQFNALMTVLRGMVNSK